MKIELKNYLHKNEAKYCLVGKIKGLAEENKRASFLFKNKKYGVGKAWILCRRKEALSNSIRYHLLAYAFLSGRTYKSVEAKCSSDHQPSAKIIYNIVKQSFSDFQLGLHKINEDTVSNWLEFQIGWSLKCCRAN